MNHAPAFNWRERCRDFGLEPHEVKAVSQRYDMYQRYTDERGGDTLPLERWYTWYRVEKLSEGHAMRSPPVQGCSVGPEVEAGGPVVSEQDFLQLLLAYRESRTRG